MKRAVMLLAMTASVCVFAADLPSRFDWRDVDGKCYVTPVRTGGESFSFAYAPMDFLEAAYLIDKKLDYNSLNASEKEAILTELPYQKATDAAHRKGAFTYNNVGSVVYYEMPDLTKSLNWMLREGYNGRKVTDVIMVSPNETRRSLKQGLMIRPLLAGYQHVPAYINQGKYLYFPEYPPTKYHSPDYYRTVCVVGFDDSISRSCFKSEGEVPEGDGAWIVKGSYGTSWGEDGYFYISYYDQSLFHYDSINPLYVYDYIYLMQYDTKRAYGKMFCHDIQGPSGFEMTDLDSYAVVFEADEDCVISAVGMLGLWDGNSITIYAFTGCDKDNPASGELVIDGEEIRFPHSPGYHIMDLPKSFNVKKGERFSIIADCVGGIGLMTVDSPVKGRYYRSHWHKDGVYKMQFTDMVDDDDDNACYIAAYTPNDSDIKITLEEIDGMKLLADDTVGEEPFWEEIAKSGLLDRTMCHKKWEKPVADEENPLVTVAVCPEACEVQIEVQSGGDWEAYPSVSWLSIKPSSSGKGVYYAKLSIEENRTGAIRVGQVEFVQGEKKRTVRIVQDRFRIYLSRTASINTYSTSQVYYMTWRGGRIRDLWVTANGHWATETEFGDFVSCIPSAGPPFLHVKERVDVGFARDVDSQVLTVDFTNGTAVARLMVYIVPPPHTSAPDEDHWLRVSPSRILVSALGSSGIGVNVDSCSRWWISSVPEWFDSAQMTDPVCMGEGAVGLSIPANDSGSERTGIVSFANEHGKTASIEVVQQQPPPPPEEAVKTYWNNPLNMYIGDLKTYFFGEYYIDRYGFSINNKTNNISLATNDEIKVSLYAWVNLDRYRDDFSVLDGVVMRLTLDGVKTYDRVMTGAEFRSTYSSERYTQTYIVWEDAEFPMLQGLEPGVHTLTAEINATHIIHESNYADNIRSIEFVIEDVPTEADWQFPEIGNPPQPETITIRFHANGGKGDMPNQTFDVGDPPRLNPNRFSTQGRHFIGWSKNATGVVDVSELYLDEAQIPDSEDGDGGFLDLYAVWGKPGHIRGKLNQDGEWHTSVSVEKGRSHLFWVDGFSADTSLTGIDAEGMFQYEESGEIKTNVIYASEEFGLFDESDNCTAIYCILTTNDWSLVEQAPSNVRFRVAVDGFYDGENANNNKFMFGHADGIVPVCLMWDVRFDAGEGATISGEDSSILDCNFANGSPIGNLPIPMRENFYFVGWFTAPDGGERVLSSALVQEDMTLYAHWTDQPFARFVIPEVTADEKGLATVAVFGGNDKNSASMKLYLTYNTAASADLDLAKGAVDGVTPKGGLKFPLTLNWEAGEIGEKVITIPVKADKTVEDDEFFTLQLADVQGMELGEDRVCTVTILDTNDKTLKTTVTPYKPKKGEAVSTNSVTVAVADGGAMGSSRPTMGNVGGFVSGTGEYTAGSKLTLTAEPRPGWTFVGWRRAGDSAPYQDGDILSTKAKWQIVVTNDEEYVAVFEKIPYVRGLADPADGGKVSGSGLCARGKKVTLKASANKNFTFLGWRQAYPSGLAATSPASGEELENSPSKIEGVPEGRGSKTVPGDYVATTASLVIDRSAKPGASSKTSTTITNVAEDVTYYAVFKSDPEVFVTVDATDGTGAEPTGKGAGKYVAGTITGEGKYAPGKKVTLKAAANKGYVFAGWYAYPSGLAATSPVSGEESDAQGAGCLSQAASYMIDKMPSNDVEYVAKFVTADEDKASIELAVNGEAVGRDDLIAPRQTNVWCGVYLEWPVAADALSAATVKVAGLPAGLKFTDKPVTSKVGSGKTAVTVTNVPANTIYGAPTAVSKTRRDGVIAPYQVVFTVTTAGKSSQTFAINLYIDPLPAWAVGTFDGAVRSYPSGLAATSPVSGEELEVPSGEEPCGTVSLAVDAKGKISGKLLRDDGTWTLSADSFARVEGLDNLENLEHLEKLVFYATVIGKNGKLLETNEVTVAATNGIGVATGAAAWGHAALPDDGGLAALPEWTAYQNLWKRIDTKADMPVIKKDIKVVHELVEGDANNKLTLTFKKDGAVAFAGKVGGASVSGSSQLVLVRRDEPIALYRVTLYAPPKPTARPLFDGFCATFAVELTTDEQNVVTEVTVGLNDGGDGGDGGSN